MAKYLFLLKRKIITITITITIIITYALVTVKDTGTGIDLEVLPKIFSKFITKSFEGLGLGLYISKNIVEAHGGKIWAENDSNNKHGSIGAIFYFTLPLINSNMTSNNKVDK